MKRAFVFVLLAMFAPPALAHVGNHPSLHDTVAGILARIRTSLPLEQAKEMKTEQLEDFLTEEERHVLATEFLTFRVDVPVKVQVVWNGPEKSRPFWLDASWTRAAEEVKVEKRGYEVWSKPFEAGEVGLGVPCLDGYGEGYFVVVSPQAPGTEVKIIDIYPGQHRTTKADGDLRPFADEGEWKLESMPAAWAGSTVIRGVSDRNEEVALANIWRTTPHPSSAAPDHVVLTWAGDPKTTQAVNWRTNTEVTAGAVRYWPQGQPDAKKVVEAQYTPMEDPMLLNDARIHRFDAQITGLAASTTYDYEIGTSPEGPWCCAASFSTAPAEPIPFKFIYMGDAQNGLDTWGELVRKANEREPDTAFYIMAGDLVDRGGERDDWDALFQNAKGVYDRKQLVPCPGNHEYQGDAGPWMYLQQFALPDNGPKTIAPECAYSFEYSNALFLILDSNLPPQDQAEWIDAQLAQSKATWKFAVYHHPAYSSSPKRNNKAVREVWGSLFDKYHVDLALQGHDHAYLRTYPMKGEQRVGSAAEGTIYIVSVSGVKYYDQGEFDYTEVGFTNISTYQVLDITIEGNKLEYKSYDYAGNVKDEFVIEK